MKRGRHAGDKELYSMADHEIDLTRTYDAIVVGSGAAGGMAAHVLTSRGLKVLMLEAGKKLPIEKELRSMEWPYDNAIGERSRPTAIRLHLMSTPYAILPMVRGLKSPSIFTAM